VAVSAVVWYDWHLLAWMYELNKMKINFVTDLEGSQQTWW